MHIFLNEYKGLYIKVKEWLDEERKQNEGLYDHVFGTITDGTEKIIIGRIECAEALLKQMEQWERKRGE